MTDDLQLLRAYAANASEDAFAEVVRRHLGLVYSAAFRQVGDAQLAQEFTQAVFVNPSTTSTNRTARFDRATPLGALRDFADALDNSDSNRVMAALQLNTPAARSLANAFGEAVAAEHEFKRVVTARFGPKPIRLINISFGQRSLDDEAAVKDAVLYTDADHAIVRLPSRSQPDQPHTVRLVRVNGLWKFPDAGLPGMNDGPEKTAAIFRQAALSIKACGEEIVAGQHDSYEDASRALARRFMASR